MRRTLCGVATSLVLGLLWGCGHGPCGPNDRFRRSGSQVTESRPVEGFDAVSVYGGSRLILRQGGTESLRVTADEHVLPWLTTEVRDGRLWLGPDEAHDTHSMRDVVYEVTFRELRDLEVSGAVRVEIEDIDEDRLTARLSGASMVRAYGAVEDVEFGLSGASRWEAPDLRSRRLAASLSGASYARVRVSDHLGVHASGASVLEYFGDPVVSSSLSGSSLVRRLGP